MSEYVEYNSDINHLFLSIIKNTFDFFELVM